jgi:hypothetical protein
MARAEILTLYVEKKKKTEWLEYILMGTKQINGSREIIVPTIL